MRAGAKRSKPAATAVWVVKRFPARVTASATDGQLRIEVSDSGPGFDLAAIAPGHGLDNLVERLEALFGAHAHLNVLRRGGCCVVEMVLPRT